jgi:protein-S-isoprenylcysteine O-methyltransferase Ste14
MAEVASWLFPMWKIDKTNLIHIVLAHSYLVYLLSLLIGLGIDIFWSFRFSWQGADIFGGILIFAGPLLILWAQRTSEKLIVKRICDIHGICADDFRKGPYAFTRSPTHLGLALMIIGLGFVLSSSSIIVATLIAYVLTRVTFVRKEEKLLEEKYGEVYRTYKTQVHI